MEEDKTFVIKVSRQSSAAHSMIYGSIRLPPPLFFSAAAVVPVEGVRNSFVSLQFSSSFVFELRSRSVLLIVLGCRAVF